MLEQLELCDAPVRTGGPRPKIDDPDVLLEAARRMLPLVKAWHIRSGRKMPANGLWIDSIADALGERYDAYDRCRYLEMHHGWEPDVELGMKQRAEFVLGHHDIR